jgi:3-oxoacyl-(acyl-carrier-protein) synthase
MSVHTNTLPGTKNLTTVDVGDYDSSALRILKDGENVEGEEVDLVLSNSFGFGGVNAVIAFGKYK